MQSDVNYSTKESELDIKYGLYHYGTIDSKPSDQAYTSVKYLYTDIINIRQNYIRLGFHLEEFSRYEYYHDFGFQTLWQFCEKNLGLDKSAVSRCINVYREFNASKSVKYENGLKTIGAAIELDEKWKEYSYSQLCEMVSMDDVQRSQVKPDMTIKQIREIKKNIKESNVSRDVSSVATSQPEPKRFDYDEYKNKNGIVLQNYIKKLDHKDLVALYIYDNNGKQIIPGLMVNLLEFNKHGLYIRLLNADSGYFL